jgi:hypothetical protein
MITIEYGDGKSSTLNREDADCFGVFKECLKDLNVDKLTIPANIQCKEETLRNIVRLLDATPDQFKTLSKQQLFDLLLLSNYLNCEQVLTSAAVYALRRMEKMDAKAMRTFFDVKQ